MAMCQAVPAEQLFLGNGAGAARRREGAGDGHPLLHGIQAGSACCIQATTETSRSLECGGGVLGFFMWVAKQAWGLGLSAHTPGSSRSCAPSLGQQGKRQAKGSQYGSSGGLGLLMLPIITIKLGTAHILRGDL